MTFRRRSDFLPRFSPTKAGFSAAALILVMSLAPIALLTGCGTARTSSGLIYRINPPGLTVQGLRAEPAATQLELTLRLANFSTVSTRFAGFEGTVELAGFGTLPVAAGFDIAVAPLSSDIYKVSLAVDPRLSTRLSEHASGRGAIGYRLEGQIVTSEPSGRYPVEFTSRLNPVPGRPGDFR